MLGTTQAQISRWRDKGKTIGFTNGCFDLLHPGHIHLLSQAADHCDHLIVGLELDASVKRLKGSNRPIQPEQTGLGLWPPCPMSQPLFCFVMTRRRPL